MRGDWRLGEAGGVSPADGQYREKALEFDRTDLGLSPDCHFLAV